MSVNYKPEDRVVTNDLRMHKVLEVGEETLLTDDGVVLKLDIIARVRGSEFQSVKDLEKKYGKGGDRKNV